MNDDKIENPRLWYVRRGTDVQGPFPTELVRRYALLGRVRRDDELSTDRRTWQPLTALPDLTPEQLVKEGSHQDSAQRLQSLRRWEDERDGLDRRRGESAHADRDLRRRGSDRRRAEPLAALASRVRRSAQRADVQEQPKETYTGRYVFLVLFVVTIVALAILFPDKYVPDATQCGAVPAPGVNWSDCHLEGVQLRGADLGKANLNSALLPGAELDGANLVAANLDYAVLNMARLHGADLGGASMVGTSLRQADLSGANLQGANLSYAILAGAVLTNATLSGARLDHAIWIDERVCAPGSVGRCITGAASTR